MKPTKLLLTLFVLCGAIVQSTAQLVLPQASPAASVMQTAGLTDITIDYSSPGVKGRTIFGGLVPYNQIWRTGANASTKIREFRYPSESPILRLRSGHFSILQLPQQHLEISLHHRIQPEPFLCPPPCRCPK